MERREKLLQQLETIVDQPIRLMVACGNQNRTLLKSGIHRQLPEKLELVVGPGCSICVMPSGHIDAFVKIGMQPKVITAAGEDLLQVQGSKQSLGSIRDSGARVEIVSTPQEALDIAKKEAEHIVVYPAVGFEASAFNIAEVILKAAKLGVDNFCVIPSIRLLPPTISRLMEDPELRIQGLLYSDNTNAFSDTETYSELAKKHNLCCYIGGLTVDEVLEGLVSLVRQVRKGVVEVQNIGSSPFSSEELLHARKTVSQVFFTVDTDWRGMGIIERSGFVIRDELSLYDATKRFNISFQERRESCICYCNSIISGRGLPTDCPAFGMICSPDNPVGPCMISGEGICYSYFKYNLQTGM